MMPPVANAMVRGECRKNLRVNRLTTNQDGLPQNSRPALRHQIENGGGRWASPPPSNQLRRLFSPPFWPASDARCGLFLKLPPLFCPPFFPASDARLGSSAKLPLPPRCSVISVLPFRFEVNSGFHQWNSLLIGRRNWNSFRSFFISNNHHFITEYNVTKD